MERFSGPTNRVGQRDVTRDADLQNDLGADSLDMVEMLSKFQIEFNCTFPGEEQEQIRTVGNVIDVIKSTSALDWICDGQVQPAKKNVAPKAAEPVQKVAIQKPSAKETTVTLTNVSKGNEKPTTLNCGTITDAQKQHFLAANSKYKPNMTDDDFHECGFILYYAQSSKGVLPYGMPEKFRPSKRKIGENELVVEMIPLDANKCGSCDNYNCPKYIASGNCTSPFICSRRNSGF